MAREQWIELSRKLRDRVCAYFNPEQLGVIDEFIQTAGQAASFDQVHQEDRSSLIDEFRQLSREAKGDSRGWKFNRDEIQRKIR
jgi:hypothetical protein